ncbi:hypothetical protein WA538_000884 [Blastocystis sp. DL]
MLLQIRGLSCMRTPARKVTSCIAICTVQWLRRNTSRNSVPLCVLFSRITYQTKVAIVTNLEAPQKLLDTVDILYQINEKDEDRHCGKQWRTRALYNAYPPFNISFVVDAQVYPCDAAAPNEILDLFDKSGVDLSMGNRKTRPGNIMGAGALIRASERMRQFWIETFKLMVRAHVTDDQWAIMSTRNRKGKQLNVSFRSLSFNWLFASHGVDNKGNFFGNGVCFRVSIPVTGRVRFANDNTYYCTFMNGKHNEYIHKTRAFYESRHCQTNGRGLRLAFSETEMTNLTSPYSSPPLQWEVFRNYSKTDLFWPRE